MLPEVAFNNSQMSGGAQAIAAPPHFCSFLLWMKRHFFSLPPCVSVVLLVLSLVSPLGL